ncbi:hypothetical protein KUTeg_008760 [Tegillarca granosa]|uniref:Impact N-terminal domain-containing protein n=1 Tax=Tegillarca granosa TaxID=220873 RepID=A0ABQ9FA04_TEGGR|nr:hypothetical protein KUTeg_008760 [Tegillarca granosa]
MGRAVSITSNQNVREALAQLLSMPSVASSTHNIVAYRFTDDKGVMHYGIDDDGEYGGGRCILNSMKEDGINNALVVVSRVFGQKLGHKRFSYFKNAAKSAIQRVAPKSK